MNTHYHDGLSLDSAMVSGHGGRGPGDEPDNRLRLLAEMKLPGRAWLEFEVHPDETRSRLYLTATFDPLGVWGLAYWYSVWPLHRFVFEGTLRGIARAAESKHR